MEFLFVVVLVVFGLIVQYGIIYQGVLRALEMHAYRQQQREQAQADEA